MLECKMYVYVSNKSKRFYIILFILKSYVRNIQ
jgi:hypothetical protein